jgi:amino acid adenylation domain-containing protein
MNNLIKLINKNIKKNNNLNAIKMGNKYVTYGELSSSALSIASILLKNKAKNEGIVIAGQRSFEAYFGILASIYAGCYWLPINTKYSYQKINSIFDQSKIRFVVGNKKDVQIILNKIDKKNLSRIKLIIIHDKEIKDVKFSSLVKNFENIKTRLKKPIKVDDSQLAYLIFTSGSTGTPKGVQVTRSNLYNWLKNMNSMYKIDKGFNASQTYDLSFDLSVADIFFTWTNGGVLNILNTEELIMPFDYIVREKIKVWSSVPTLAMFLYKMNLLKKNIFPDLRISIFCGEPLPKFLAEAWQEAAPNSTVENLYGPTEATIWLSRFVYSKKRDKFFSFNNNILPIGTPFNGHHMKVINDKEELLKDGEIGEIVYAGPQITKGYLNDKKKTNESFKNFKWDKKKLTWYKSGDLGLKNPKNRFFEYVGRKDNQFKFGGKRIECGEIEAFLRKFEKLKDAIVVPVKDDNNSIKEIVAFISGKIKANEEKKIRKNSEKFLEKIFFPNRIISIKKFPLTISGKIDRNKLKEYL